MKPPDFSPAAEQDLDEILDYIAERRPTAAVKIVDELIRACERISRQPTLGPSCPELGSGLRRFVVRSYVIYYRARAEGVRVERVLHGARNAARLFAGSEEE